MAIMMPNSRVRSITLMKMVLKMPAAISTPDDEVHEHAAALLHGDEAT